MDNRYFSDKVVEWYQWNKRDLPWRETKDPYRIWFSEIILQQTRVNQGLPYYKKFIETFPTVSGPCAKHPNKKYCDFGRDWGITPVHEISISVPGSRDPLSTENFRRVLKNCEITRNWRLHSCSNCFYCFQGTCCCGRW